MRILIAAFILFCISCGVNEPHPEAMKLFLPKDTDTASNAPGDPAKTLSIVLAKPGTVYYYVGEAESMQKTDFKGIRAVIFAKKKEMGNGFVVLIKPSKYATYKNTVDALDEMFVNDVKKYALIDISKAEEEYLANEIGKE